MTEDNQDSKTPKLRLSRQAEENKPEETPEAAPNQKPELQLKRPTEVTKREIGTTENAPSALNNPSETKPEEPEEQSFDPEHPFQGIVEEPKTENRDRTPPELPSKPAPVLKDGSGEKLEEAISKIGEKEGGEKSKGLLISIGVIIILLGVLGGAGYGLYYVLKESGGLSDSNSTTASEAGEPQEKSGGLLSGSIAKAKAAISKKTGSDTSAAEEASLAEVLTKPVQNAGEEATNDTETPEAAPGMATTAVEEGSVADFLKNAHIGGVRTGDRPMLIMNGERYNNGDLVNPEYGLRFIGFRDEKLAFRDDKGIIYIKSF